MRTKVVLRQCWAKLYDFLYNFVSTLANCFGMLCCWCDCCARLGRRGRRYSSLSPHSSNGGGGPGGPGGEESMTRIRLGFRGKDMWVETRGLNFHQTFGRYAVLMDSKDRIIPFSKNGELIEELDPDMTYKIVANRYGEAGEDRWKKHKENEKVKAKKQKQQLKVTKPPSSLLLDGNLHGNIVQEQPLIQIVDEHHQVEVDLVDEDGEGLLDTSTLDHFTIDIPNNNNNEHKDDHEDSYQASSTINHTNT
ncbi:hypothetical protein SAMD00019534_028270 [Acytostelium subglobosum LB1]|uniref:hypothetical protein n=1 Tax=Acytostelium subglobosum LB1 TaxID=1410327 RepID=UPI0006448179|nr:hypothetical protein SAMD00019534_028270 [Acytostelium subglobosum LB1]GAM19652.1 hypothetical protein SAMD00019534_028270 [Acytostelium subglobosum LB1]|eukprot:XP_012756414.1 hypothetical protein SAMD00019534_028270 [Acytostelium subglobosum LB1]